MATPGPAKTVQKTAGGTPGFLMSGVTQESWVVLLAARSLHAVSGTRVHPAKGGTCDRSGCSGTCRVTAEAWATTMLHHYRLQPAPLSLPGLWNPKTGGRKKKELNQAAVKVLDPVSSSCKQLCKARTTPAHARPFRKGLRRRPTMALRIKALKLFLVCICYSISPGPEWLELRGRFFLGDNTDTPLWQPTFRSWILG